jgi:peptidoglycan/LPS O-acetylase OafA/YrhL
LAKNLRHASHSYYFPELDGLRAIAALSVVTVHMRDAFWRPFNGQLGVILFFVISGFLITSIALREESATGRPRLRAFYIRRSFRIFPLYYFVLAVYCLLILRLGITPEKRQPLLWELPYFLTYFQELPFFGEATHPQGPFYQSWSLGIEEKFYIVWPVLCFVILKHRHSLRIPIACVLIVVTAFIGSYIAPYAYILFGCVLALGLPYDIFRRGVTNLGAPLVWLSFAALALVQMFGGDVPLLYAAVSTLFIASILVIKTPLSVALAWPPLVFIGQLSYGIYLIHILCLNLIQRFIHLGTVLTYLATVAISIAFATFLHFAIEQPLVRLGRRLAARVHDAPESAPQSSNCVPALITPVRDSIESGARSST